MEVSGLDQESDLVRLILDMYARILEGATIGQLRRAADQIKAAGRKDVI